MALFPGTLGYLLSCPRLSTGQNTRWPALGLSQHSAGLLLALLLGIAGRPAWGAPMAWEQHQGYRVAPLSILPGGKAGFTSLPGAVTGVLFTNQLLFEAAVANQNLLNGAGLALGDYDNDGWCDLFLCNLN